MVSELVEAAVCEQATGCSGAGGYRAWAREQGYSRCEVYDWTSSAGDWTFLVSRDGSEWFVMYQENRYPRSGFERGINTEGPGSEDWPLVGTFEDACEEVAAFYC